MHEYDGYIRSVYDGDTCRADIDLGFNHWVHKMPIRWQGIDTPELNSKDPRQKALAVVARDRVRELILDKWVVIKTFKAGKYGRWMGTFWLLEDWYQDIPYEKSINQLLLNEKLAEEFMVDD